MTAELNIIVGIVSNLCMITFVTTSYILSFISLSNNGRPCVLVIDHEPWVRLSMFSFNLLLLLFHRYNCYVSCVLLRSLILLQLIKYLLYIAIGVV